MQKNNLLYFTQQEKDQRKIGNEQILQILQKTHIAQGNEITIAICICPPLRTTCGLARRSHAMA